MSGSSPRTIASQSLLDRRANREEGGPSPSGEQQRLEPRQAEHLGDRRQASANTRVDHEIDSFLDEDSRRGRPLTDHPDVPLAVGPADPVEVFADRHGELARGPEKVAKVDIIIDRPSASRSATFRLSSASTSRSR